LSPCLVCKAIQRNAVANIDRRHIVQYVSRSILHMSVQFYTLPGNTSGTASIPILNGPTLLAGLTVETSAENNVVSIRANIAWAAWPPGRTRVLFEIWRGAPGTGTEVASVLDSADGRYDSAAVTEFSHFDAGFVSPQTHTYVLTAEIYDPGPAGNSAAATGPLIFSALVTNLPSVIFSELPNNNFGGA